MTHLLLISLLALLHHSPATACMERRAPRIAVQAAEGEATYGVPAALLLVIGFAETHLGCDHGEGGGWGAPVDPTHRHTAGTHLHAARALASSYRACGNWYGAIVRFRTGLCTTRRRLRGYTPEYALRMTTRIYADAHQPLPAGQWRPLTRAERRARAAAQAEAPRTPNGS